jgi:hypothetical protein
MAWRPVLWIVNMSTSQKPSPATQLPRQKRGAPVGNTNALKHGFYSRNFRRQESADLEASDFDGLADEVSLLRVSLRRLFDFASETPDPKLMISTLKSLSVSCIHLATLIHKHRTFTGEENPIISLIGESVSEVNDDQFQKRKRRRST